HLPMGQDELLVRCLIAVRYQFGSSIGLSYEGATGEGPRSTMTPTSTTWKSGREAAPRSLTRPATTRSGTPLPAAGPMPPACAPATASAPHPAATPLWSAAGPPRSRPDGCETSPSPAT